LPTSGLIALAYDDQATDRAFAWLIVMWATLSLITAAKVDLMFASSRKAAQRLRVQVLRE